MNRISNSWIELRDPYVLTSCHRLGFYDHVLSLHISDFNARLFWDLEATTLHFGLWNLQYIQTSLDIEKKKVITEVNIFYKLNKETKLLEAQPRIKSNLANLLIYELFVLVDNLIITKGEGRFKSKVTILIEKRRNTGISVGISCV